MKRNFTAKKKTIISNFGPAEAKRRLSWCDCSDGGFQRPLSQPNVAEKAAAMLRGEWYTSTIIIILFNGKRYVADGQHRIAAVIESGCTIEVIEIEYACRTKEELVELFNSIDDKKTCKARSLVAVSKTAEYFLGTGIPYKVLEMFARGYSCRNPKGGSWYPRKISNRQKVDIITGNKSLLAICRLIYADLFAGRKPAEYKNLTRNPVILAIIKSYETDPEAAKVFWTAVLEGDGTKGSSTLWLWKKLATTKQIVGFSDDTNYSEDAGVATPKRFYFWCSRAWNAWRRSEALPQKVIMKGNTPEPKFL